MEFHTWSVVWDIIGKVFIKEGQNMTVRQQKIFNAIVEAYHFALDERWMRNDEEYTALWEDWKRKANNDELTKIEEIATLFFIAMFKFGE